MCGRLGTALKNNLIFYAVLMVSKCTCTVSPPFGCWINLAGVLHVEFVDRPLGLLGSCCSLSPANWRLQMSLASASQLQMRSVS